jgi:hypothetical protein
MFATDSLGELNFVLEFDLPEEISDNQDHVKLSVHHVNVPIIKIPECPIGYRPISRRSSGELHCIEFYEYIKDKLHLLEKWSHALHDKPFGWSNSDLYIDAKLYGYKDDELVTSFELHRLYQTLFPTIKFENQVDLQFSFADMKTVAL